MQQQLERGHGSSETIALEIESSESHDEAGAADKPPDLAQSHDPGDSLPQPKAQAAATSSSSSSTSSNSSSSGSSSDSLSSSGGSSRRGGGRVGGLGRGRHGHKHRDAIGRILPILREVLSENGAARRADRANVKEALSRAEARGIIIWGEGAVYKSRRNVESAIINLYYTDVLLNINAAG